MMEKAGHDMVDTNGVALIKGAHVKYSYSELRIPVFTGTIIEKADGFYVEHSNKVTVKLDDSIKYVEVVKY